MYTKHSLVLESGEIRKINSVRGIRARLESKSLFTIFRENLVFFPSFTENSAESWDYGIDP